MGEMTCLAFDTEFTVANSNRFLQIQTEWVTLGGCFCQLCGVQSILVDLWEIFLIPQIIPGSHQAPGPVGIKISKICHLASRAHILMGSSWQSWAYLLPTLSSTCAWSRSFIRIWCTLPWILDSCNQLLTWHFQSSPSLAYLKWNVWIPPATYSSHHLLYLRKKTLPISTQLFMLKKNLEVFPTSSLSLSTSIQFIIEASLLYL